MGKVYSSMNDIDCFDDGEYVCKSPANASIILKNFNEECLVHKKILVCFSAAVSNRKTKTGPFYSGVRLAEKLNIPLVSFADYLVTNNKNLNLAWYCGCEKNPDFQDKIANFLDKISSFYGCELIILGGSGAGFASLAIASKIKSNAFIISSNPQTSICRYIDRHVENYVNTAFKSEVDKSYVNSKNIFEKFGLTYDVNDIEYGKNIEILYLINFDDEHHIEDHLLYFIQNKEFLSHGENTFKFGDSGLYFGDFGVGHATPGVHFFNTIINDIRNGKNVEQILRHIEGGLSGLLDKPNKVAKISGKGACARISIM